MSEPHPVETSSATIPITGTKILFDPATGHGHGSSFSRGSELLSSTDYSMMGAFEPL